MRIYFLICFFCTILKSEPAQAQLSLDLNKFQCLGTEVKYKTDEAIQSGVLFFLNHRDRENPSIKYSNIYLLVEGGQNLQLIGDTSAMMGVQDLLVSPDSKYMALLIVGEGHPWIEVYDLQTLISQQRLDLKAELNPYPGYINLHSWQGDLLVIESDMDLLLLNKDESLIGIEPSEQGKPFLYDLKTNQYSTYK